MNAIRNAARSRLVSIAVALSLVVLAAVFHRQLIAWFSGGSMPGVSPVGAAMGETAPKGSGAAPAGGMPGEVDHYTCSMHPYVKEAAPGKCPICGMNLIPVTKEQQQEGVVMIDDARRQLIAQLVVGGMQGDGKPD